MRKETVDPRLREANPMAESKRNKQVPDETFSDEIRSGYRKRCGHIAECDCLNGARVPGVEGAGQQRTMVSREVESQVRDAMDEIQSGQPAVPGVDGAGERAVLQNLARSVRQHFRPGFEGATLHWRDVLDALTEAEKILGDTIS